MNSEWNEDEAGRFIKAHDDEQGRDVALLAYVTRLVGSRPDLAMHGGGNTSHKGIIRTVAGDEVTALFVKASGVPLADALPADFVCLDLDYLKKLRTVPSLTDEGMAGEFRTRMLRPCDRLPSIETLMHAFIDQISIIHTHPSAILALTNRSGGRDEVIAALGDTAGVVSYADSGLALGRAVADEFDRGKGLSAIVVMHHGLITWGRELKQAYENTLAIIGKAEEHLRKSRRNIFQATTETTPGTAMQRYVKTAPLIRGLLSPVSGNPDNPFGKIVLEPLVSREILDIIDSAEAATFAGTAPLTPDYLVRTKTSPLFIENPCHDDLNTLREQIAGGIKSFSSRYDSYIGKYSAGMTGFDASGFDLLPRVLLLPGVGAVCAGADLHAARMVRDITEQELSVKRIIRETGGNYLGLTEEHLFSMEFRRLQRAKVSGKVNKPLRGHVAIVTGAAGAIGSGICEELLGLGCHVAATDIAGDHLENMDLAYRKRYKDRALVVPLDVTDGASVSAAFEKTVETFGGVDIVIINAGLAHVSSLIEMEIDTFRKLERVNVDGTMLMLAQAGKLFREQNTGGDIVLISTKNVFSPGAKFGAYSATKAAAHQLCRIASIEFADMGVRVNMVAPDAVFAHGEKRSGLWAQVGPDRMKARGLDEKGLEEYYRGRNLLKARVTAEHVARAVVFFVTRQTPTTGATIPVDGGLPDATPR